MYSDIPVHAHIWKIVEQPMRVRCPETNTPHLICNFKNVQTHATNPTHLFYKGGGWEGWSGGVNHKGMVHK